MTCTATKKKTRKNKGRETRKNLMEDGEINRMKWVTGWRGVTGAAAIDLHQSTVKDEKCGSLTKRPTTIPPSLSRVNDNMHYVSCNLAGEPQGFTSEDRVMTAREEHHKSTAEACSDALDVICVCVCVWICLCTQLLLGDLSFFFKRPQPWCSRDFAAVRC